MKQMSVMCAELKNQIEQGIKDFNDALAANDYDKMVRAEAETKVAEQRFAEQAMMDMFSSHKGDEHPAYEILKEGEVAVLRHKAVRVNGVLDSWELNSDGVAYVNIKKMFKYLQGMGMKVGLDPWESRADRMAELLCEWAHNDVKGSAKGVYETFKMGKKAREIEVGPNPTSNTSMLKFLQSLIDMIVGPDLAKAINPDLKFLQHCYDKRGKDRGHLSTLKGSGVLSVVGDIIHRIANGYAYTVDYKKITEKSAALEAQRAANRKAKEAKAAAEAKPDPEPIVVPVPAETEKTEDAA